MGLKTSQSKKRYQTQTKLNKNRCVLKEGLQICKRCVLWIYLHFTRANLLLGITERDHIHIFDMDSTCIRELTYIAFPKQLLEVASTYTYGLV